jgi:glycosyltransferase involved in cell wall biosynthesis
MGVDQTICNEKLFLTENNDWQEFADKMETAIDMDQSISSEFFQHFYWKNIAAKAAEVIGNLNKN